MTNPVALPVPCVADHLPALEDLYAVYQVWLEAEWPDHPGQLNSQRAPSALSNFQRALRALSYAQDQGGELRGVSARVLLAEGQRIGALVEQGLLIEASLKGKGAPKVQLVQNMQSTARALAKFVKVSGQHQFHSGFHKLSHRPVRKCRDRLAYLDWPESLRQDLEQFQRWLGATLTSEEARYRQKKLSASSVKGFRTRLGQYVKWRLERPLPANNLVDLISEREFANYLDDYLREDPATGVNLGGYSGARMTGVALGSLVRYLVATERFDPIENRATPEAVRARPTRSRTEQNQRFSEGELLKKEFYRLGRESFNDGALKKKLVRNAKVKGLTPQDLRSLRDEGFSSVAQRTDNQSGSYIENFCRKRSATVFGISAETPLRIRTLSLMQWEDLTRRPDGRWHILVSGDQLKIKMLGDNINTYEMTYSRETSRYIDEYRDVLETHFGPRFETEVPYVFPAMDVATKRGRAISTKALGRGMTQLALELRDIWFNPHSTRSIVASYLIRSLGAPGIVVAAKLLGDRPETVLKFYLKELNGQETEIDLYFTLLQQKSLPQAVR